MRSLVQDLRYGFRSFLKTPVPTVVALSTIALGIGANCAVFSLINAVLIRALPYKDPERLVVMWGSSAAKGMRNQLLSPLDYRDFVQQNQVFEHIGAFQTQSSVLTGSQLPERVETAAVSPDIFEALGMRPSAGRGFAPDEDAPSKNSVALLGNGLWRRRFGGDPGILGSSLNLDGRSYTVIGIAPPGFRLADSISELWIPYTPDPKELLPSARGHRALTVLASLKDGVTRRQAEIEMQAIARRIAEANPDKNAGFTVDVVPLREQMAGNLRPTLWILMAAVTLVLLIACANVANLLLARASMREKEIAVRAAVGANPRRIARQLLTESVLLSLTGGLLGLALAYWLTPLLVRVAPWNIPRVQEIPVDWRVLAFTLCVSLAAGVAFGLAPTLTSAGLDLSSMLKASGRSNSGNRAGTRMRDALVVSQVACSVALLSGAGLLIRSFARLERVDPGFRTDHVLTMQISLAPASYPGMKAELFYRQIVDRVTGLPGVESAGICRFLPLAGSDASANFRLENQPTLSTVDQPRAKFRAASGGYFTALLIPLLTGRLFDRSDDERTPKVAIINQAAQRLYWPNQDPIGKRILSGLDKDQWSTIVGVVGNVKHAGLDAETNPETYYHFLQIPPEAVSAAEATMALVIRTSADPRAMISAVRNEVGMLDRQLPVFNVRTMDEVVSGSIAQPRFRTLLFSLFAGLAVLLAAIGLYGVMAYSVTLRINELGVRAALGAQPADIVKLVVGRGMHLALAGIGIGLVLGLAGTRILSGLLFGVSSLDPIAFGVTCLVILGVSAIASLLPALRAAGLDPVEALRTQ